MILETHPPPRCDHAKLTIRSPRMSSNGSGGAPSVRCCLMAWNLAAGLDVGQRVAARRPPHHERHLQNIEAALRVAAVTIIVQVAGQASDLAAIGGHAPDLREPMSTRMSRPTLVLSRYSSRLCLAKASPRRISDRPAP